MFIDLPFVVAAFVEKQKPALWALITLGVLSTGIIGILARLIYLKCNPEPENEADRLNQEPIEMAVINIAFCQHALTNNTQLNA